MSTRRRTALPLVTRRVVVKAYGGAEQLVAEDAVVPAPGPGEVRLRQRAVGVNFIDVYQRRGWIPGMPAEGGTPGMEAAGNGTHEVRNWVIAHAAAGGRGFDLIDYRVMPEVYVGCGWASDWAGTRSSTRRWARTSPTAAGASASRSNFSVYYGHNGLSRSRAGTNGSPRPG